MELIIHPLVSYRLREAQACHNIIVSDYLYVADNHQCFEAVVVADDDKIFYLVLGGAVNLVVVALNYHVFNSGRDFHLIVVAVDGEVFDVVPNPLVAVVLIDCVRILIVRGLLLRLLLMSCVSGVMVVCGCPSLSSVGARWEARGCALEGLVSLLLLLLEDRIEVGHLRHALSIEKEHIRVHFSFQIFIYYTF